MKSIHKFMREVIEIEKKEKDVVLLVKAVNVDGEVYVELNYTSWGVSGTSKRIPLPFSLALVCRMPDGSSLINRVVGIYEEYPEDGLLGTTAYMLRDTPFGVISYLSCLSETFRNWTIEKLGTDF